MDYVVDQLLELTPEEMENALDDYSYRYLDAIYDVLILKLEEELSIGDFIRMRNERDGYGNYRDETPYEIRLTTLLALVRDRIESMSQERGR